MGDDTLYSGTVAAATEGFLFGIPSIAFSQVDKDWVHLDSAARVAKEFVMRYKEFSQSVCLLNVNIPNIPYEEIHRFTSTKLGKRHASEPVIKMLDPRGKELFWIGPPGAVKDAGPGTDFYATSMGEVSVTPLQIDLTHCDLLKKFPQEMLLRVKA